MILCWNYCALNGHFVYPKEIIVVVTTRICLNIIEVVYIKVNVFYVVVNGGKQV